MSEVSQPGIDEQFDAMQQAMEWVEVGRAFDQMLPMVKDAFTSPKLDSAETSAATKNAIDAAAGLRAALFASYYTGTSPEVLREKPRLRIKGAGTDGYFAWLDGGDGGMDAPASVSLKGSVPNHNTVNPLGRMIGSKLLQTDSKATWLWDYDVRAGGDSTPHIRATFKPIGSDDTLPTIGISAQHYVMGGNTHPVRLLINDQEMEIDQADPEIVKATLGFAGALTQWITKPEFATRGRYAVGESVM